MEEAAAVAMDYITSEWLLHCGLEMKSSSDTALDNLPAEVQHLLVEIKHKETKSQGTHNPTTPPYLRLFLQRIPELLQEITKETSRYIRHSLRSGASPLTTKDEQIPQKIDQNYAEVDRLAQEKLKIAERLAFLIQRARTRLDYDLRRVLILQGDDPGQPAFVSTSRNPVQEMNDTLRLTIAETSPVASPPPIVLATTQAPTQKSNVPSTTPFSSQRPPVGSPAVTHHAERKV